MLESFLGSTDVRAMERGLMLDLMPVLSNQAHSSHTSSLSETGFGCRTGEHAGAARHSQRRGTDPEPRRYDDAHDGSVWKWKLKWAGGFWKAGMTKDPSNGLWQRR
ncbi:hypothetical protein VaNZ11_010523 [Volvox africanus]|uniref:Uncharacterized protein n=1 Tax=Volvox africanus TaxID=51714 RepID=A0ABQ5S9J9_9CHLO|nr:hypothetical protein VaNZ11_010523 [Volvox africanus]